MNDLSPREEDWISPSAVLRCRSKSKQISVNKISTYRVQTVELVMEILLFSENKHTADGKTLSLRFADNKVSLAITRQFPRTKATQKLERHGKKSINSRS